MSLVKKAQYSGVDVGSIADLITLDSNTADDFEDTDIPGDGSCEECGLDHDGDYENAYLWHLKNSTPEEEILIDDEDDEDDSGNFDQDSDLGFDEGEEEYGIENPDEQGDFGFDAKDHNADEEDEEGEVTILVKDEGEEPKVFKFDLPMIPGSELTEKDDVEVDEDDEDEAEVEEKDIWDWQSRGLENFPSWVHDMLNVHIPKHSGHDTTGIERVMSFLSALNKNISKATRFDLKGVLDIGQLEHARHSINDGLFRCEQRLGRLNKKKKASDEDGAIIKEAQKISGVHGVVVTVPLLISRLARVCINGMVSGGHDIEFMFNKLSEKYNLDNREQAELMQLIEDMGLAVPRDRGFKLDEEFGRTKQDGFDWNQNFYA